MTDKTIEQELDELEGAEEEKETPSVSPADEQTDDTGGDADSEKKRSVVHEYEQLLNAKKGLGEEVKKLEKKVAALREEKRTHTFSGEGVTKNTDTVTSEEQATESFSSVDDWKKFIDEKSTAAVKPVATELERFKATQKSKAFKHFVKRHPEYTAAHDGNDEKMKALLETYGRVRARSEFDFDEVLEDLEDAWAVQNRTQLYEKEKLVRKAKIEGELSLADIAASGGSAPEKVEAETPTATAADVRAWREAQRYMPAMALKDYLVRKRELEAAEIHL